MDLKSICLQTTEVAKTAGAFIRSKINTIDKADIESKGIHNYVTFVDKQTEAIIYKALLQILPESGFIMEEGTATYNNQD